MIPSHQQDSFTASDGTVIGYQVYENPKGTPMLLANGLGGTHAAYRFIIESFASDFEFISWDYRGLYSSGRPKNGYAGLSIERHAQDAIELLDHLGIDRFCALGWSMGVQVLVELCREHKGRLDNLILHNGAYGSTFKHVFGAPFTSKIIYSLCDLLQKNNKWTQKAVEVLAGTSFLNFAVTHLGVANKNLDQDVFAEMATGFKCLDIHLYIEQLYCLDHHDAKSVLETITCPTLLVFGTRDMMTPLTIAKEMENLIPNASLQTIRGGSHYAAVEFPHEMNLILRSFLKNNALILSADQHP